MDELGIRVFGMTPFDGGVCALLGIPMVPVSYAFMRKISRSIMDCSHLQHCWIVFDFMHFYIVKNRNPLMIVGIFYPAYLFI